MDRPQKSPGIYLRKFAASLGKPGQAREARKVVQSAMNSFNPSRKPPISTPMDYEKFVSVNSFSLENDSNRDLFIVPRDDITESLTSDENRAILSQSATNYSFNDTRWLFVHDALNNYLAPKRVINFNYANFGSDGVFDAKIEDLKPLQFESDLVLEQEDSIISKNKSLESGIIRAGYLFHVRDSGLLENFKSAKKRYCEFRRDEFGNVVLELQKQKGIYTHTPYRVRQVSIITKKGKNVLEVLCSDADRRPIILAADPDNDLTPWFINVNQNLHTISGSSNVVGVDEADVASNASNGIIIDTNSEEASSDIVLVESSGKEKFDTKRDPSAIASSIKPPHIKRHNLFSLYRHNKAIGMEQNCSLFTPSLCRRKQEKESLSVPCRFIVEFTKFDLKLRLAHGEPEQVEPFFMRVFLFDARSAQRVSEEFHLDPNTDEMNTLIHGRSRKRINDFVVGADVEEDGHCGVAHDKLSDRAVNKIVYSVAEPHRDIFLVMRFERILSTDSFGDGYMRTVSDNKSAMKLQKMVLQASTNLSKYRMPFALTARSVFQDMLGSHKHKKVSDVLRVFRVETNKISELDLQKFLAELPRIEKSSKYSVIPNMSVSLKIDILSGTDELSMLINSSFMPSNSWNMAPDSSISAAFEAQSFVSVSSKPYSNLVNHLYVYPLCLKYDNQKAFGKARNIACKVSLMVSCRSGIAKAKAIYDRFAYPVPFVHSTKTAVQYHEQNPVFSEEIKVRLPFTLESTDHLLFTFVHISVAEALSSKSSQTIESIVGYAWLPLIKKAHLVIESNMQEIALPIAAELPKEYWNYQSLGIGKGQIRPEIRWIENGKPLFRLSLHLVSTIFTADRNLQSFFQSCQRLQQTGIIVDTSDNFFSMSTCAVLSSSLSSISTEGDEKVEKYFRHITQKAKALQNIEMDVLISFLPIILNRLLFLLPICNSNSMALSILKTLAQLLEKVTNFGKEKYLRSFIYERFQIFNVKSKSKTEDISTHSAITKYIPILISDVEEDPNELAIAFRYLWFFFDIFSKSLAQRVLYVGLNKLPRNVRFSPDLLFHIEAMLEKLTSTVINKHHEIPDSCRAASLSVAYFLRCCLSFMDRGAVFCWIHSMVEKFDESESKALREFKLDLLKVLSGHEHWLPLSLSALIDDDDKIVAEVSGLENDAIPSTGFLSTFFSKIFSGSGQFSGITKQLNYSNEFCISESYCRHHFLVGLLLQELSMALRENREYRRKVLEVVRNVLTQHSMDNRYSCSVAQGKIATLYVPVLHLVLSNLSELDSTAKHSVDDVVPYSSAIRLESHSRTNSLASDMRDSNQRYSGSLQLYALKATGNKYKCGVTSTSANNDAQTVILREKLTKNEVSDLFVSVLYILRYLPRRLYHCLFLNFEANGLIQDFITMLELILKTFSCYGLKKESRILDASSIWQWKSKSGTATTESLASSALSFVETAKSDAATNVDDYADETSVFSSLQTAYFMQEIALILLDTMQILGDYLSIRTCSLADTCIDDAVGKLLPIYLWLLGENWSEPLRLYCLSRLASFVNLFRAKFFESGPIDCLLALIEGLLLQISSRFASIQQSAAVLLHSLLRYGYDYASFQFARQSVATDFDRFSTRRSYHTKTVASAERLGRTGSQLTVALARLLGQKVLLTDNSNFEKGLSILESLISSKAGCRPGVFEQAVQDLIVQMKGVLSATGALNEAMSDPVRLAELNIQLANSYKGSAALRSAWFESLADMHIRERCYSEAAVCLVHCVAIIARELSVKGLKNVDWLLFNCINETVIEEERVLDMQRESVQQAGYSLDDYISKIEKTVRFMFLAERYEAVGPIYRLLIPVYEEQDDHRSLVSIYTALQQAHAMADQVRLTGKRHLGSYFKVAFYGQQHFKDDHDSVWIYRESGVISLAEACERMRVLYSTELGHNRIQIISESELVKSNFKDEIAYIQITYVLPVKENGFCEEEYHSIYSLHTNIRKFMYELVEVEKNTAAAVPDVARQCLRRIYVLTNDPFPNTRRRLRVISRNEILLSPLELARDKIIFKAKQIRNVLEAAKRRTLSKERPAESLDIKRLQLLLQGAIQPTVNVGPLAYAEAFTDPVQVKRYGQEGLKSLSEAFNILMDECSKALVANEAAIGYDQVEYQAMLKNAFTAMQERLKGFFGDSICSPCLLPSNDASAKELATRSSFHVFDSIGGLSS